MARRSPPATNKTERIRSDKSASTKPAEALEDMLRLAGPMLSSSVAKAFESRGVQAATARQRTSRLSAETEALKGVNFPKRARFLYHQDDLGTGRYYQSLEAAIREHHPACAAALNAIDAAGGILPLKQFYVACGSPIRQKKQLGADSVLSQLHAGGLVRKADVAGIGECILRGGRDSLLPLVPSMRARMLAESFLLDAVAGWLGRMNMVSQGAVKIRSANAANPAFSTFEFDLCGPSYLSPLTQVQAGKVTHGFMVADVLLTKELSLQDISPFLRKCAMLKSIRGVRPFVPMLLGQMFAPDALHALRAKGVIATRAESLFGRDVQMALGSLIEVLSSAAKAPPEKIEFLLKRLGAIEGAAGNLRGALFEMVVCHMVRELEGGTADVGIVLQEAETGRSAEVDIVLRRQQQITCYECKGHQPTSRTTLPEIEHWLTDRVPLIRRALAEQHGNMTTLRFEYWTCGSFDADALETLHRAATSTTRYEIAWKDGPAIRSYSNKLTASGVRKHLADHFFSHTLAKAMA